MVSNFAFGFFGLRILSFGFFSMPESPDPKSREPLPPPTCVAQCDLDYAELDVTSNFSFLRGASHPDELVYTAAQLGYRAIAITDHHTLAGAARAHAAAKSCG